jgi:hypothetical protein
VAGQLASEGQEAADEMDEQAEQVEVRQYLAEQCWQKVQQG